MIGGGILENGDGVLFVIILFVVKCWRGRFFKKNRFLVDVGRGVDEVFLFILKGKINGVDLVF